MKKERGIALIVLVILIVAIIALAILAVVKIKDGYESKNKINNVETDIQKNVIEQNNMIKNEAEATGLTLGNLIKDANDYGKTVNYSVTVNGIVVDDWKVFYKTDEYVYLITTERLVGGAIPLNIPGANVNGQYISFSSELNTTGVIQNPELWLAKEASNYSKDSNGRCASYFLDEQYWSEFKNSKYGNNLVGAIGTPTAEMFAVSWNEKRKTTGDEVTYSKELGLFYKEEWGGYTIAYDAGYGAIGYSAVGINLEVTDSLYSANIDEEETGYWLASPFANSWLMNLEKGKELSDFGGDPILLNGYGIRPVVCFKAEIPAKIGSVTDIEI